MTLPRGARGYNGCLMIVHDIDVQGYKRRASPKAGSCEVRWRRADDVEGWRYGRSSLACSQPQQAEP